jgi:hypothetical protein
VGCSLVIVWEKIMDVKIVFTIVRNRELFSFHCEDNRIAQKHMDVMKFEHIMS